MSRFRKRSVVVEAIPAGVVLDGASSGRFASSTLNDGDTLMPEWVIDAFQGMVIGFEADAVLVNTHHGQARAERADWIIRGVDGELYPCKADVFERTYEPVKEGWVEDPFKKLDAIGLGGFELWEVYRCDHADPDQACGIRKVQSDSGVLEMIVSDTNRDECCHHMKLSDAEHIVRLHNEFKMPVLTIKGDVSAGRVVDLRHHLSELRGSSQPMIVDAFTPTHLALTSNGLELGGTVDKVRELPRDSFRAGYEVENQPPPIAQPDIRPTWELVIADLEREHRILAVRETRDVIEMVISDARERDRVGRERYGVPLTPRNGRDSIVDAYQEALDLVVYLRNEMEEHDEPGMSLLYVSAQSLAIQLRERIARRGRQKP